MTEAEREIARHIAAQLDAMPPHTVQRIAAGHIVRRFVFGRRSADRWLWDRLNLSQLVAQHDDEYWKQFLLNSPDNN